MRRRVSSSFQSFLNAQGGSNLAPIGIMAPREQGNRAVSRRIINEINVKEEHHVRKNNHSFFRDRRMVPLCLQGKRWTFYKTVELDPDEGFGNLSREKQVALLRSLHTTDEFDGEPGWPCIVESFIFCGINL